MPDERPVKEKKPAKLASRSRRAAFILPALALAVLGGWFWSRRGNEPAVSPQDGSHLVSTLHLETFVLNLADPTQKSYLRVGIDLGLNRELKHGEDPPAARVRDTIIGVLALAKVDELLTAKGKESLKEDLLHALKQRVPELGVEEVYFTEFLIQR